MKLLLRCLVAVAITCITPSAFAQGLSAWTNTGTTDFNTGANWTSGAVPGPGDSAVVLTGFTTSGVGGGITVSTGGNANITIDSSSSNSVAAFAVSGTGFNSTVVGTLNLNYTGGAVLTTNELDVVGSTTLNFNGAMVVTNGNILVGSEEPPTSLPATPVGPGTLNILSGSVNLDSSSQTQLEIGQSSSSTPGTVTVSGSAVLTTGFNTAIGMTDGTGTLTLSGNSVMNVGTPGDPQSDFYSLEIAAGANSTGTLNISGNSTLNMTNPDSIFQTALEAGSTATVNQSGNSTVNLSTTVLFGVNGTSTYNLQSGALNITGGTTNLGAGATGILNESGGALTVGPAATFHLGAGGTGTFNLSGGTADFQGTLILGYGGTGLLNQTGGTLTSENQAVLIGLSSSGTYTLSGGSATFNAGATVGQGGIFNLAGGTFSLGTGANSLVIQAGGVVNQTASTVVMDPTTGQTIDLSAAGGIYNLNTGGTLATGASGFVAGGGALNFGGGTLLLTGGGTFTDPFTTQHTLASGTISTIDATTIDPTHGAFTSVVMGSLTGSGGINFNGISGTTIFTFNGTNNYTGVTQITAGTLTTNASNVEYSSLLDVVSSNSVLNLNVDAGGVALVGGLAGNGQINVAYTNANDALVLKSASNFGGTLNLGVGGTAGQLQVYSGTLANVTDASGAGNNLIVGGSALVPFPDGSTAPISGTVTMTNSQFRGTTSVAAGFTLNALTQTGNVSTDLTTTNIGGATNNAGTLIVTGTIGNVSGSSTVNYVGINGDVTNTGTFLVGQSVGTVASGSTVSMIDVNGNLTNNGTFGSVTTLSTPGAATAKVNGNLTSPGILNIRVLGAASDLFQVGGTADLSNGTIKLTGSATLGTHTYEIVDATGGITDTGLTTGPETALLSYSIEPLTNPDVLDLTITQKSIASFAQTPNQVAVANALDNTPGGNSLKSAFNALTPTQGPLVIPVALDQLSPEALQYARNIGFENSTFMVQNMNGIMANIRNGYSGIDSSGLGFITPGFENGLGRSLSNLVAANDPYHTSAPNGVNYYPDSGTPAASAPAPYSAPSPWAGTESSGPISDSPMPLRTSSSPPALREPSFSGFISGDVVLANLNQNNGVGNAPPGQANYTAGDVLAGVSYRMTSHFSAGVLFDYNHTDASTDANGSKTKIDTYSPGVFATFFDNNFYVNGLFSFGFNNYSNTRNIPFAGSSANSSPTGEQYVTDLDFGYDFHPATQWTVGPTLGLTYTHIDINSFSESGAGQADLSINSQHADSFRSRLGAHASYEARVGSLVLQPTIFVAWQHEYLDQTNGITSQFSIPGSGPFTIQTASPGADTALAGIGLTASLDSSMVLYLNYMVDAGASDYFAQSVMAGIKASF